MNLSEVNLSRRALLAGVAGGIGIGVAGDQLKDKTYEIASEAQCHMKRQMAKGRQDPYAGLQESIAGFTRNWEVQQRIAGSEQPTPIKIFNATSYKSDDKLWSGTLVLPKSEYTVLQVSGVTDPQISLRVLEIQFQDETMDEPEKILHPIIQTEENNSAITTLHVLPSGNTEVEIYGTDYSRGLTGDDIEVNVFAITGDPVYETLIRTIPRLHLRENIGNITHNMPIDAVGFISTRPDGDVLGENWQDFVGQDGGRSLCTASKPDDREIIGYEWLKPDGRLKKRIMQSGVHHEPDSYEVHDVPVFISDAIDTDRQIETDNNVPSRVITTDQVVALYTDYRDPYHSHLNISKQVLAWRERVRKNELDPVSEAEMERFIRDELYGRDLIREYN